MSLNPLPPAASTMAPRVDQLFVAMGALTGLVAIPIALLRVSDERIVELLLKSPRVVEVVFHSCSVNGGARGFSIDEKHVVAFAPPSR